MNESYGALLLAEMQQLRAELQELKGRVPDNARTWISPTELAKLAGCSTKSIENWRNAGIIRSSSFRPGGRSFLFHRKEALADIEQRKG